MEASEKPAGPGNQRLTGLLLAAFLLYVVVLTAGGLLSRTWLPPVATRHGSGIDFLIHYLLITTGIIFIAGHLILGIFVWRYSRAGRSAYRPLKPRSEWLLALVPVFFMAAVSEVGVLALGLPTWMEVYGEAPEDALIVEVVGKQFEWIIRYPGKDGKFGETKPELVNDVRNPLGLDRKDPAAKDDVVLRGNLHLPEGRTVSVRLRSHDTLHSFTVPHFRIKQDLVPGFTTTTTFTPTRGGTYEIVCAELCGLGHYRMRGLAIVEAAADFEKWLSEQPGWFE